MVTETASSGARALQTPTGCPETCGTAAAGSVGRRSTRQHSQTELQLSAGGREAVSGCTEAADYSPGGGVTYDIGGDDGDGNSKLLQKPTETEVDAAEPAGGGGSGKEAVSRRRPTKDGERNQRLRKALRKSLAGQMDLLQRVSRAFLTYGCA